MRDVEPPGSHVGGHEDGELARLEGRDDFVPLVLEHVAVEGAAAQLRLHLVRVRVRVRVSLASATTEQLLEVSFDLEGPQ